MAWKFWCNGRPFKLKWIVLFRIVQFNKATFCNQILSFSTLLCFASSERIRMNENTNFSILKMPRRFKWKLKNINVSEYLNNYILNLMVSYFSRNGSWVYSTNLNVFLHAATSVSCTLPLFHAGDIVTSWVIIHYKSRFWNLQGGVGAFT